MHVNPVAHVFDWVFFIHFGVWLASPEVRGGSFGLGWVSHGQVRRAGGTEAYTIPLAGCSLNKLVSTLRTSSIWIGLDCLGLINIHFNIVDLPSL